ncbi:hypothetical protein BH09BAC3_BH09BAC3_19410 [soil metagenome]
MEPLTQKILLPTLVAVIKGVAIVGLLLDVAAFYANRNAGRVSTFVKKKISTIKLNSLLHLSKS